MVQFRTDLSAQNGQSAQPKSDSYDDNLNLDVLIVGAGFGGVYLLHRLRDELGLKCKVYEAGTDLGGIWHWNCYPGARVDSAVPVYEYSFPKVWKDWYWSVKYPGFDELRDYFEHVDKVLDVKKDVAIYSRVVGAQYNKSTKVWDIKTEDGRTAHARFFINAIGFAAKRHFPDWKGLEKFKGEIHHSSFWPENGVDVKGKRVAVIGTGSTGVQIAQETSKEAASVTVFQRTPNLCLPMQQRPLTREEQEKNKATYPDLFRYRLTTFAGFPFDYVKRKTLDATPEQREAFYEELWEHGGFHYWLATYDDMLFDKAANDEAYKFWAKKTRARISAPEKRDILAPLKAPHAWGTKRPSLEQNYYEQLDKPHNFVVDIKKNPVVEVKENGIVTADGKLREFDVIALATGFDSVTGGMKNMGLRDENGVLLSEKWKHGTWSYLGTTCNDYPVSGQFMIQRAFTDSIRTCSSCTALKAQPHSPTDLPVSKSRATGSSRPLPSARRRGLFTSTPPRTPRRSGGKRSPSCPTRRCSRPPTHGTWERTSQASRESSSTMQVASRCTRKSSMRLSRTLRGLSRRLPSQNHGQQCT